MENVLLAIKVTEFTAKNYQYVTQITAVALLWPLVTRVAAVLPVIALLDILVVVLDLMVVNLERPLVT